jgi:hypothetical protein
MPARSAWSAAGLRQTGGRHGFSPVVAAAAYLTSSGSHVGACPCPFSADTVRLSPNDRQSR